MEASVSQQHFTLGALNKRIHCHRGNILFQLKALLDILATILSSKGRGPEDTASNFLERKA